MSRQEEREQAIASCRWGRTHGCDADVAHGQGTREGDRPRRSDTPAQGSSKGHATAVLLLLAAKAATKAATWLGSRRGTWPLTVVTLDW